MPARSNPCTGIEKIQKGSLAEKAGLKPNDRLISINGHKIGDAIDLMFYSNEQSLEILLNRNREMKTVAVKMDDDATGDLGIVMKPFKIKTCRNNCIFCFVSQLPRGMRNSLYVKDDDYRMSFLFGNYITMTNLSGQDKERIAEQRLSPLYISVHSTNTLLRNKMLGNHKAGDILKEIKFLVDNKIRMHTQIVLCPGYNDGGNLEKTISDLYRFYPYVMSVAVVPVGLTAYRKKIIRPVEKEDALRALETIHKFQSRFKRKHGEDIVYGADELYIKGEVEFPLLHDYGDLPQIENGVGMVPLFIHQSKRVRMPQSLQNTENRTQKTEKNKKRFVTFTGTSFYPYLSKFAGKLKKGGIDIEAVAVENAYFGKSVTVAGLLTGRDLIKSIGDFIKKDDILLIPDVVMREGDDVMLDDVSRQDIEEVLGAKAVIVESTPKGIVDAVAALS